MEYVTLNNGVKIPMLGFGVYQIPANETEKAVREAVEAGYRLFDTAWVYGNEKEVGAALNACGLDRKELFVTTKIWTKDMGYERTQKAIDQALQTMGMEYLDLLLIHEPMGDYYGSWHAMEEAYHAGKVRAIGICNMWPDRLYDLILNNDVTPHLTQIETHPFQQQRTIEPLLKKYRIVHEAWAPFAEGRERIFTNKVLSTIAEAHNRTVAQVILRWLFQRGIVTLTKSVHRERMLENASIFDFELTEEEMETIRLLDHDRPLILNNRDLEVVERIHPRLAQKQYEDRLKTNGLNR